MRFSNTIALERSDMPLFNFNGIFSKSALAANADSGALERAKASSPVKTVFNSQATMYGRLKDWDVGKFVPVAEGAGVYYGGWQGWLTDEGVSQFDADRSCGVAASSNTLCYMARHAPGRSALYTKPDLSRKSYSAFQKDIFEFISPKAWGVPTVDILIGRVLKYAESRKVKITPHKVDSGWNIDTVRPYLSNALNDDKPVMLLTWNSPIKDLQMHWVTVTAYYKDGTEKILTSNWGGKVEYDFTTWFGGNSLYKGLIYFD
ncbi:MAG: hypothetical protein LBU32_31435 [Clostridiales bacterium]|jgi:hypothetical protein|nr:hypothetical protein [Clostridiales bacterium]